MRREIPGYALWERDAIPPHMVDLARRRTQFLASVIMCEGQIPLQDLFVSAYLQGMYDTVQVMEITNGTR